MTRSEFRLAAQPTLRATDWIFSGFDLLNGFFEVVSSIIAELAAHLPGPPCDAAWIIVIDVGKEACVGELVEPGVFGAGQRETRYQLPDPGALAVTTRLLDGDGEATQNKAGQATAIMAPVLVDWHSLAYLIRPRGCVTVQSPSAC